MDNLAREIPGTILWIAPFYNRTGFGSDARAAVSALHRAGARIKIFPVDTIEPGVDDCDLNLLKSLEATPLIPPVTLIISHVPKKAMLDIKLPEPNLKVIATTVFDCNAEGTPPPTEMLDVCRKLDQIWVMPVKERESFIRNGFSPEKVRLVYWPHGWVDNPVIPSFVPENTSKDKPFRFLNISLFLPRRRWDTLIQAYLEEFKKSDNVELYLKVTYPFWHPLPGKPREDLFNLVDSIRQKTGSDLPIIVDEEIGTRTDLVKLIDSCNVYVSTDTAPTAPIAEARIRRRLTIMPRGFNLGPEELYVEIPQNPDMKIQLTPGMLLYQPNHKGGYMPILDVMEVRKALRRAFDMSPAERQERCEKFSYIPGPQETIPNIVNSIKAGWEFKAKQEEAGQNIIIERSGGLGDVLMTFPLADIIRKRNPRKKVVLVTAERYLPMAKKAGNFDDVITSCPDEMDGVYFNLNPAAYGLSDMHQIDAYLHKLSINAEDSEKEIKINIPEELNKNIEMVIKKRDIKKSKIVVVHAAKGDVNRTLPFEVWNNLVDLMLDEGYIVVTIGSNQADKSRGVYLFRKKGVINLTDKLSALETVSLLRYADLFVTTDSGPVQLASATDVAIAGIYSVVKGEYRLPYRHGKAGWNSIAIKPDCREYGCYKKMHEPDFMESYLKKNKSGIDNVRLFAEWCVSNEKYKCVRKEIKAGTIWEKCKILLNSREEIKTGKISDYHESFSDAYGLYEAGKYHDSLLKLDEAENYYNNDPDKSSKISLADLNVLRGIIYLHLEDLDKSRISFEKALNLDPASSEACSGLGEIFFRVGLKQEAKTMFEWAVKNDPQSQGAKARLAKANLQLGFSDEHNTLDSPNEEGKNDAELLIDEAYELFQKKQHSEALSKLLLAEDILEEIEPESKRMELFSNVLNFKGFNYLALNKLEKAKQNFEQALNINPESSQACAGLGEIFYLSENDQEAKTMYEWAIKNDSGNSFALNGLAKVNKTLGLPESHNSLISE